MLFEPSRPHSDDAVSSRMRLIKGIGGEGGHFIKDFLRDFSRYTVAHSTRDAFLLGAVNKVLAFLRHDIFFLFRHRAAHQIAAAVGISGQIAHDLHDLLLIDHAAVGNGQNRLKQRRFIANRLRVLLAFDVARNGIHRSRAIKRYGGDDIFKILRAHIGQKRPHTAAFELEYAVRIAVRYHLIHRVVVKRNILRFEDNAALFEQIQRIPDDGQRTKPQKIHLEQTKLLNDPHGVLGRHHIVVGLQRHIIGHRLVCNQHAGGVRTGVAGHPLKRQRRFIQAFDARVVVHHGAQIRAHFQRFFERHSKVHRHGFGHLVDLCVGIAKHAPHIPDDAARRHGAKGDDLADVILPVAAGYVINDLLAPLIAKVHVNIRHGHALRV